MRDIVMVIGLHLIYYALLPGLLFFILYKINSKKNMIKGIGYFNKEEENDSDLKEKKKDLKKLKVIFVVYILIFIPAVNFMSIYITETSMERERMYTGDGFRSVVYDPVTHQIGPTSDTDSVIEEMEQNNDTWVTEELKEEVDFDDLTNLPGMLSAYRLEKQHKRTTHIIITYHYLTPIPITRSIGFDVWDVDEDVSLSLEEERTLVYPMTPFWTDPF